MKRIFILIIATLTAVGAVAQDAPVKKDIVWQEIPNDSIPEAEANDLQNDNSRLLIQSGTGNNGDLSICVAGFELLLEKADCPPGSPCERYIDRMKNSKRYKGRISPMEIGFNGLKGNAPYAAYPPAEDGFFDLNMAASLQWTFNLFQFSSALTKSHSVGFTMAVGITANNYTLETPVRFEKGADKMLHPVYTTEDLKKAKLRTTMLHIPAAFEFNSPNGKFFFSAGGYLDLTMGSCVKSKKPKEKLSSPYVNFVQAGITARIGFKYFYIYGNYAFTDLFRKGHGPRFTPYSFGIGF